MVGNDKYSHPSLDDLDRKLARRIAIRNGFFIEAGANDGFNQSNTYYLERFLGWRGILVEAIPELFQRCRTERPRAHVYNCALVPFDYAEKTVEMVHCNLMSVVKGAMGNGVAEQSHIDRGAKLQPGTAVYTVRVAARTLTSIIEEVQPPTINLLSLDVEGYEINVLKGLDFTRFRPENICIEVREASKVEAFLGEVGYGRVEVLSDVGSRRDLLFQDLSTKVGGGS